MLTQLIVRNFKRLQQVEIPLDKTVVFVGPNNSGKTTALQALALWDVGLRAWIEKRGSQSSAQKRPGVAINRRDLISTPVPNAALLWNGLHVRRAKANGKERGTQNIRIDVTVCGITNDKSWKCGLEFDFTNDESFVCRPLRLSEHDDDPVEKARFSEIPDEAGNIHFAFLPPMSGLTAEEPLLQPGRINVLMGQGETAQVLRNLCHQIVEKDADRQEKNWPKIVERIERLFGAKLDEPVYLQERGEITLSYKEKGIHLDISAAGRGLQQTLLLLAHLYANPNSVLLLDEPDAHLEILRQRETFRTITEVAEAQGSQVIAASHSEVVLNEAAATASVVAFVGKPHRLNDRPSQTIKSLTEIGWEDYYKAEQTGWVLYLEGPSDLEILRTFARILDYEEAQQVLARPFFHPVATNLPQRAREHFHGLREAKSDLVGLAIFDRIDKTLNEDQYLVELSWQQREIENYLCTEKVLLAYAQHNLSDDLFGQAESMHRVEIMGEAIREVVSALETLDKPDMKPWSTEIKASDDFLDPVLKKYFAKLNLPVLLRKSNYHEFARLMQPEDVSDEVCEKLDAIVAVSKKAHPLEK